MDRFAGYATIAGSARRALVAASTVLPLGAGIVLVLAVAPGERDARALAAPASTFSGSCQLTGSVSFQPALTNSPRSVRQYARASGACSGTFTDRSGRTHQLSSAPATYQASEQASGATCGGGTDSGTGVLGFPYGSVSFSISEVRAGPAVTARAQGADGGSAAGQGNVSPSESPVTVLQACAGSGLSQAPIDIRLSTTPSISG